MSGFPYSKIHYFLTCVEKGNMVLRKGRSAARKPFSRLGLKQAQSDCSDKFMRILITDDKRPVGSGPARTVQ